MKQRWKVAALAALLAACGSGRSPSRTDAPAAPEVASLDDVDVVVAVDAAAGRETVTLVDRATGRRQVVSDEPLTADVIEVTEEEST